MRLDSGFGIVAPTLTLVLSLGLVACTRPSQHDRQAVDQWLTCDECINHERDSLRAIGSDGVAMLESALVGPSPYRREIMRDKFRQSYPAAPIAALSESQYINGLLANYVASYQKRAALGLASIGGSRARSALDEASVASTSRGYRNDVVRTIEFARQTLEAIPFPGTVVPVRARFGDTVTLRAHQSEPFTGDELADLADGPFPPTSVFLSRNANELKFVAVGPPGVHTVAVSNVGTTTRTQIAVLTIGTMLDANDRQTLKCTNAHCDVDSAPPIPVPALPYTTFLSLWRIPPRVDTLDVFRIPPGPARQITAHLDWFGDANLDLGWVRCSTYGAVGGTDGATAGKPENISVLIPAGECWTLTVTMRAGAADRAFAQLRVTSP